MTYRTEWLRLTMWPRMLSVRPVSITAAIQLRAAFGLSIIGLVIFGLAGFGLSQLGL